MNHSRPNVETAQVVTINWMYKQIVIYTYNGILFSPKEEWGIDKCYEVNEPLGHYAKWKKPRGFPGGLVANTLLSNAEGMVRELRSQMPLSQKIKMENRSNVVTIQ